MKTIVTANLQDFLHDNLLLVVSHTLLGPLSQPERTSSSFFHKLGSLRVVCFSWATTNLKCPCWPDETSYIMSLSHWLLGSTLSCQCQRFLLNQRMFNPFPKVRVIHSFLLVSCHGCSWKLFSTPGCLAVTS